MNRVLQDGVKEKSHRKQREKENISEKKEMEVCEEEQVEDRRREKGSGIGTSSGEGGTSEQSPIRERKKRGNWEMQRDGNSGREKEESEADGSFFLQDLVSVAQWSFTSSGKTFSLSLLLLLFFPDSVFLPFSAYISPLCTLVLSPSFSSVSLSLYDFGFPSVSLILSLPLSALFSMASTFCIPPPFFFRHCSPRMHLFKACFTKTVQKLRKSRMAGLEEEEAD